MTTATRTLTISDACAIADIVRMAQGTQKVAYLPADRSEPLLGIARSIGTEGGGFLRRDEDVRDGFLRITTRSGMEVFIPMAELIPAAKNATFVTYDWS